MLGFGRIKTHLRKRRWRILNSHNETSCANYFRFSRVEVGKMTYGTLYVVDCSPSKAKLKIGSYCSIAQGVKFLLGAEHNINTVSTYPFKVKAFGVAPYEAGSKGDIVVEDDVWICENAIILGGVKIGRGAIVAAGAVVTKDVEPYSIVAGNPAHLIKYRLEEDLRKKLLQIDVARLFDSFCKEDLNDIYSALTKEKLERMLKNEE